MGVAIVIGCGQLNNAFGIRPKVVHKEFYLNFFETLSNLLDA